MVTSVQCMEKLLLFSYPSLSRTIPTRYLALTGCIYKTIHVVHCLESKTLLENSQYGFRNQRITTNHLVRLETFIRETFICIEHISSVSFGLENEYDTT